MRRYNPLFFAGLGIGLAMLLTVAVIIISFNTTSNRFLEKQSMYSTMDRKAESIMPANENINTEAGRSPVVLVSVMTIILILSGTLYIEQKGQENN
jgi:heme/copper-type cytochrome/quinol oxidase subunit 3